MYVVEDLRLTRRIGEDLLALRAIYVPNLFGETVDPLKVSSLLEDMIENVEILKARNQRSKEMLDA